MKQAQTLVNTYQVRELIGMKTSNLKYHRNKGNIRGYQLAGQRQYFYKVSDINKLLTEHSDIFTGQDLPKIGIVKTTINIEGVKN